VLTSGAARRAPPIVFPGERQGGEIDVDGSIDQAQKSAPDFSSSETMAVVSIGIIAGVIPALQPILLGGLNAAGQLTPEQIGQAGMVEGLGMLAGSFLATLFLPPRSLRMLSVVSLLLMVAAASSSGNMVLILRALNGTVSGVILWVLVGMLTRASDGARMFAIYVTAQAILATALSWIMSLYVLPSFGISGGYMLIAALALLLLVPASLFLPRSYVPLSAGRIMLPTARGLIGLFAILCFLAGILAVWVYFVPLAAGLGHDSKTAGLIVSSAIALQIVGGLCAIWAAGRLSGVSITIGSAIGCALAIVALMVLGGNVVLLVVSASLISFFWMFAPPSHLPFLLRLDPGGQSAAFISVAQIGGLSVGPLIASFAVTQHGPSGAAWVALALLLAGAAIGTAVTRFSPR
jgi:MFS transporter, DHA1 family, inner membrane transport protein